jgi:hypothetical protein
MVTTTITLSDGGPCEVKRLGIFDMDNVGPALVGPFVYTFKMADGKEVEVAYELGNITNPPQHPGVPENEIEEGTPTWYALLEYQTYTMAIEHERNRINSAIDHIMEKSRYIVERALSDDDIERIATKDDYLGVLRAALVPELTPEIIADTFNKHFNAHFQGQEIFEALDRVAPGSGGYAAIKVWEINTMTKHGYTEEQWAEISLDERARKVAAAKLPDLLETLERDKSHKEFLAKNAHPT